MIKIAICDDEPNIRHYLAALIQKQRVSHETEVAEYASLREYLSRGAGTDLLFLDIEMPQEPDGFREAESEHTAQSLPRNGMELARRIRDTDAFLQPLIIFVTGYEKYVYDAFDVDAFQYLLKPVDEQRFSEVFARAVERILAKQSRQPDTRSLFIQSAHRNKTVPLDSIYYIESRNHKVILHLKEGLFSYYARIGELEDELTDQFFRIHKGYLINLSYVDSYSRTEVELTNGERLLISRYKYADFVKAYLRFVKGRLADE